MSRIGKAPIPVPGSVKITISGRTVTAQGPKGKLSWEHPECIAVEVKDDHIHCTRSSDQDAAMHGTTRALINNLVVGVSEGFKRNMKIVGTGYRAKLEGKKLVLTVGYSHPVELDVPEGLEIADVSKKGDSFVIQGADKRLLGAFAAKVREVRPPEPYKGKGIRYADEHVRTKQGKKVGA
jgi:large subunit ribosomal protein L6